MFTVDSNHFNEFESKPPKQEVPNAIDILNNVLLRKPVISKLSRYVYCFCSFPQKFTRGEFVLLVLKQLVGLKVQNHLYPPISPAYCTLAQIPKLW